MIPATDGLDNLQPAPYYSLEHINSAINFAVELLQSEMCAKDYTDGFDFRYFAYAASALSRVSSYLELDPDAPLLIGSFDEPSIEELNQTLNS